MPVFLCYTYTHYVVFTLYYVVFTYIMYSCTVYLTTITQRLSCLDVFASRSVYVVRLSRNTSLIPRYIGHRVSSSLAAPNESV